VHRSGVGGPWERAAPESGGRGRQARGEEATCNSVGMQPPQRAYMRGLLPLPSSPPPPRTPITPLSIAPSASPLPVQWSVDRDRVSCLGTGQRGKHVGSKPTTDPPSFAPFTPSAPNATSHDGEHGLKKTQQRDTSPPRNTALRHVPVTYFHAHTPGTDLQHRTTRRGHAGWARAAVPHRAPAGQRRWSVAPKREHLQRVCLLVEQRAVPPRRAPGGWVARRGL